MIDRDEILARLPVFVFHVEEMTILTVPLVVVRDLESATLLLVASF